MMTENMNLAELEAAIQNARSIFVATQNKLTSAIEAAAKLTKAVDSETVNETMIELREAIMVFISESARALSEDPW